MIWQQFSFKNLLKSIYQFSVYSIAFTIPISTKLNSIFIILALIISLYHYISKIRKFEYARNYLLIISSVFLIYLIITLFWSPYISQDLGYLVKVISIIIFPILFYFKPLNENEVKNIIAIFISSCFLVSIYCIIIAFKKSFNDPGAYYFFNKWYFYYHNFSSGINMNAIYLATYYVIGVNFLFYLHHRHHINFLTFLILTSYFILLIFILAARMPLLSLGFVLILNISIYLKELRIKVILKLLLLCTALLLIALNTPLIRTRLKTSFNENITLANGERFSDERFVLWYAALKTWQKNNIFFGTGPGRGKKLLTNEYKLLEYKVAYENNYNAHNLYLDFLLRHGFVGLSIFIIILLTSFKKALNQKSLIYASFILIICISCITESFLSQHDGIVIFFFFNSLFYNSFKEV